MSVECNGEYSCYKTTINAESAKKVMISCNGHAACSQAEFNEQLSYGGESGEVMVTCNGGTCIDVHLL